MKGLQKELNELHDHQSEESHDLQKECAQANKDYKDLKISKHNLWVEYEEHKISVKLLNEKLLKNEEFKGQPLDVVKVHEEFGTLKSTLAKLVSGIENLDKLLRYS